MRRDKWKEIYDNAVPDMECDRVAKEVTDANYVYAGEDWVAENEQCPECGSMDTDNLDSYNTRAGDVVNYECNNCGNKWRSLVEPFDWSGKEEVTNHYWPQKYTKE